MSFLEVVGFIVIFGLVLVFCPRVAFSTVLGMILYSQYNIPIFSENMPFHAYVLTLFIVICGAVSIFIDFAVAKDFLEEL